MRSMTGYGRRQVSRDGREMTVEVKTVNHRFLDISCRLPRALSFAEDAVRKQIGAALKRGHADVNVTYLNLRQDARQVRVDEGLARQYRDAMLLMRGTLFEVGVNSSDEMRHLSDHDVSFIASQPDVL